VSVPAAESAPDPSYPPEPAAPVAPAPPTGALDLQALRTAWPQVLEAVRSGGRPGSRTARALLDPHAEVSEVDGSVVTLSFVNPNLARQFKQSHYEEIVATALGDVLSGTWRVLVVAPGQAAGGGQPTERAGAPDPGFAPGDEPMPEDPDAPVDARPRGAPEDTAVALLQTQMGATVIGEIKPV
jgi:DNA polymerase-3 subunit gamma/tau